MMLKWTTAPFWLMACLFGSSYANATPLQKNFSAWQLSCDNLNHCQARNADDHHGLVMSISRDAGERGDVQVTLSTLWDQPAPAADEPFPRLLLDGRRLVLNPREWRQEGRQLINDNLLVTNEFIATIQGGSKIQLATGAPMAMDKPTIWLNGLKAALSAMDQQQGRSGNKTAWVELGSQAANTTPAAPVTPVLPHYVKPPRLSEAEIAALTQFVASSIDSSDCTLEPAQRELKLSALSNDNALARVSCETGAYNNYSLAFIITRKAPFKADEFMLDAPFKLNGNLEVDPELVNIKFDPEQGILSTFEKGSEVGDCGAASSWLYDGTKFQLLRYSAEPTCDGYSKGQWPVLWTASIGQ